MRTVVVWTVVMTLGFAAAPKSAQAGSGPLPEWIRQLHQKEWMDYKFELPPTVRKTHPRLPYPSAKAIAYYRENVKPGSDEYKLRISRNPVLVYVVYQDKAQFDRLIGWIRTPPDKARDYQTYSDWTREWRHQLLDWCYSELSAEQRAEVAKQIVADCEQYFRHSQPLSDVAPTQTFFLNRQGMFMADAAIAAWGEAPGADKHLKDVHERFFRYILPVWHLAMDEKDGGGISIPCGYDQHIQKVIIGGLELWSSFLGEDLWKKYESWLRPYGYQPFYTHLPNLGTYPLGDGKTVLSEYSAGQAMAFATKYKDPYMLYLAEVAQHIQQGKSYKGMPERPYLIHNGQNVWYEADTTGLKPRPPETGFPAERFFGRGSGILGVRSDWTEDATYALFKLGDITSNHTHMDCGSFYIFRSGSLACDAGSYAWQGTGDVFSHPTYRGYTCQAVAHNVVTVLDPADRHVPNDGGQRAVISSWMGSPVSVEHYIRQREIYETGDMLAFDPDEVFVYAVGDVTAAYQNELSGKDTRGRADGPDIKFSKWHTHRTKRLDIMTRAFLFIRPDYFVIFDRVVTIDPDFKKAWLLHTVNKPTVSGNTMEVVRADLLKDKYGVTINKLKGIRSQDYPLHGKMFVKTLLPKDFQIDLIGGPGKEFWVEDRNYDGFNGTDAKLTADPSDPRDPCAWRIEVSPKEPRKEDLFLHVIQVGDNKALEKMAPVEYVEQGTLVGCKIAANGGTYTALFDKADGIGGHMAFEKDGKRLIDRDFAEKIMPNRKPAGLEAAASNK